MARSDLRPDLVRAWAARLMVEFRILQILADPEKYVCPDGWLCDQGAHRPTDAYASYIYRVRPHAKD